MFKWLAKKLLPVIAANIDLDIDTVVKGTGTYLRIRIEVFDFILLDRNVKTSDEAPVENPIDIFDPGNTLRLPEDFIRENTRRLNNSRKGKSIFNIGEGYGKIESV